MLERVGTARLQARLQMILDLVLTRMFVSFDREIDHSIGKSSGACLCPEFKGWARGNLFLQPGTLRIPVTHQVQVVDTDSYQRRRCDKVYGDKNCRITISMILKVQNLGK